MKDSTKQTIVVSSMMMVIIIGMKLLHYLKWLWRLYE